VLSRRQLDDAELIVVDHPGESLRGAQRRSPALLETRR
jgi:hypothetical protein